MLVELSKIAVAESMDLNGDTGGCLTASTLQLKLLAILLWAIANLFQMNKNTALSWHYFLTIIILLQGYTATMH